MLITILSLGSRHPNRHRELRCDGELCVSVSRPYRDSCAERLAPRQRTLIVGERDNVREAVMAKWGSAAALGLGTEARKPLEEATAGAAEALERSRWLAGLASWA
jgi:hypothetical protein